ncbi:GntR family transcriptional regulator [bacterium 1xD8-6]|jgi:Predicted transcriptional regulators|nr:GntR family transcriptional regulator [bacterium D16-36]RKI72974.1 GntR family transcriptional regulator [bacterium 1xD8-6]
MEWKFTDDIPIYQQIMDIIKQQIASGELAVGEKLPSVREMALAAGVNPNTMQKALAELEREGLLYSKRTAGRFVAEQEEIKKGLQEELLMGYIETFLKNMAKLGYTVEEVVEIILKHEKGEEKDGQFN